MNIICFSHIRWEEELKRPQELMRISSRSNTIFFIEPFILNSEDDGYYISKTGESLFIVSLHLQQGIGQEDNRLNDLLIDLFEQFNINQYTFWFYSPLAINFTYNFHPELIVYDCMDESNTLRFNSIFLESERRLLDTTDVVITGGKRQNDYKRNFHNNVHCVQGSIDKLHFLKARKCCNEPSDQLNIPHPRLGYYGIIDERLDIELIAAGADARPDWQFILVGPICKIDHQHLPVRDNLHYLGDKTYEEIPSYLNGWDVTLIPYVINESTRFMNPTKTNEYLAAGKPVISTRIADVVDPYGDKGLVNIIYNASELIDVAEIELKKSNTEAWLQKVDEHLIENSWEDAWSKLKEIIEDALLMKKYEENVGQKICV